MKVAQKGGLFVPYEEKFSTVAVWPTGINFIVPLNEAKNESRFQIQTRGPWGLVSKLKGLAVEKGEGGVIVHGLRSLDNARESGYAMEGKVSIGGKKYRAFTSSQMFKVNGKLADVAILYVVKKKEPTT